MKTFRLIGLMSGTSLDGLDIADVSFSLIDDQKWTFSVNHAKTVAYSDSFRKELISAPKMSGEELGLLSVKLAKFYAEQVNLFISTNDISRTDIYALSSHGQTIFHQPEKSFTQQIGNLPHLATLTGLKVITDFRTKDVALGGTGAPLIPLVDHSLFANEAEAFLNLGGFSNLSYRKNGIVYSFDVGPANIVVNHLMQTDLGQSMDVRGQLARSGKLDVGLFDSLNSLDYFKLNGPKSLGWEWVEKEILPMMEKDIGIENKLHTYIKHVSYQLAKSFENCGAKSVYVTGGGVYNDFLIECMKEEFKGDLIIPDKEIIEFKEAIGFAFLGLLRSLEEVNVLSSVTGAKIDSCSGVIFEP